MLYMRVHQYQLVFVTIIVQLAVGYRMFVSIFRRAFSHILQYWESGCLLESAPYP